MNKPRPDQFTGALMGCAVGDALGAPIEGRSREQIAAMKGITDGYRPFSHGKTKSFPAGQYTDDTQLTIATARSLIACGHVDGAGIAGEFAKLWQSGEIVGAGPVAHRAVRRLLEGVDWQDAAVVDDLPLNGAAMRIAPVGLWHCDHPDRLADDVTVASIVTHRHPLAVDAAIAVATAVAHVVTQSTVKTARLLQVVSEAVAERSPDFARHIQQLDAWLELAESTALEAIADLGPARGAHGFGIPAMAEPTVLAALYTFLRSPGDFMGTVDCALHVGGDVDTVAAIAGAISGAHNGLDAIPRHLVTGAKDSEDILELGASLFARRYP